MSDTQIYLDNNATSPMDPAVADAMVELERSGLANPASQHRSGRQALRVLEKAKVDILRSIGAAVEGMNAAHVVLTSGGTEANNLALHAGTYQREGLVILGSMEHPSLIQAAERSAICLNPVRLLPALPNGQYDLNCLAEWLDAIYSGRDPDHRQVTMVSLMQANNETGVINDIAEVVRLCRRYAIPVHSDIVQSVGKVDFNMHTLGLSSVTIASHKIHGPVGVGAYVTSPGAKVHPMLVGGGQQMGWRGGTEPVALAVGMAKSLALAEQARKDGQYERTAALRDEFELSLKRRIDRVFINGEPASRVPQTSNLSFDGLDRQALHMALDLAGISCSTGSACASGSSLPSPTLLAMGLDHIRVGSALRFSLSRFTKAAEIHRAIDVVASVVTRHREGKQAH